MKISVEISLYPLAEERYRIEIWDFINRLRNVEGLQVVTNGMSTQVFGEYDHTVSAVMAEIKRTHEAIDAAVFVCKFINVDCSLSPSED